MNVASRDIVWILAVVGIVLIGAGFAYDARFAGIPYQDSTPETSARYAQHREIAIRIMQVGGLMVVAGICGGLVSLGPGRLRRSV